MGEIKNKTVNKGDEEVYKKNAGINIYNGRVIGKKPENIEYQI